MQVIIGPEADLIADEMRGVLASRATADATGTVAGAAPRPARATGAAYAGGTPQAGRTALAGAAPTAGLAPGETGPLDPDPVRWLSVFGGAANVVALDAVAATRLRIVVREPSAVDRGRIASLDGAWVTDDTYHLVCGAAAARYAQVLSASLPGGAGGVVTRPESA